MHCTLSLCYIYAIPALTDSFPCLQLSRFLNKMSDTGVIKVEVNKGVESVTKINLEHPLVKEFSPVLLSPEACVKDSCASLSIRDKVRRNMSEFVSTR